jgi:hypothetical protein
MQNPVTKLGVVRRISYFPDQRRLRAVLADGTTHEVRDVAPERVEAARPFEDPANVERLVDESLPWRLVAGTPPKPPGSSRPAPWPGRALARSGRRMAGRFLSPLGLVQSVTYDRFARRLRLTLADGGRFESSPVSLEAARSLTPVRTRLQFDELFGAGGEWRPTREME